MNAYMIYKILTKINLENKNNIEDIFIEEFNNIEKNNLIIRNLKTSENTKKFLAYEAKEFITNNNIILPEKTSYESFRKYLINLDINHPIILKTNIELKINTNIIKLLNAEIDNETGDHLNCLFIPEQILVSQIKDFLDDTLKKSINSKEREVFDTLDSQGILNEFIERTSHSFLSSYYLLQFLKRREDITINLNEHPDFEKGSQLLTSYLKDNKQVIFITDKDVDGTLGGLISKIFKHNLPKKYQDNIIIDTFENGDSRGLNIETVKKMFNENILKENILFITIDNGVNNSQEVLAIQEFLELNKIKSKFIITDHHSHDKLTSINNILSDNVLAINPRDITEAFNVCGADTICQFLSNTLKNFITDKNKIEKTKEFMSVIAQHANIADLVFAPVSNRPSNTQNIKDLIHSFNVALNFKDILSYGTLNVKDFIENFEKELKISKEASSLIYYELQNILIRLSNFSEIMKENTRYLVKDIVSIDSFRALDDVSTKDLSDNEIFNLITNLIQIKEYLFAKEGVGKTEAEKQLETLVDDIFYSINDVNKIIVEKLTLELQKKIDYYSLYSDFCHRFDEVNPKMTKVQITKEIEEVLGEDKNTISKLTQDIYNYMKKDIDLAPAVISEYKNLTLIVLDSKVFGDVKLNKKLLNTALIKTGYNLRGKDNSGLMMFAIKNDEGYSLSIRSSSVNALEMLNSVDSKFQVYGHPMACGGVFLGNFDELKDLVSKINSYYIPSLKKEIKTNELNVFLDTEYYSDILSVSSKILKILGVDTVPDNTGINFYVNDRKNFEMSENKFSATQLDLNGTIALIPPINKFNTSRYLKLTPNSSSLYSSSLIQNLPKDLKTIEFKRDDIKPTLYEEHSIKDAIKISLDLNNDDLIEKIYKITKEISKKTNGGLALVDIETAEGFNRNGKVANIGFNLIKDDKIESFHLFNKDVKQLSPMIANLTGITPSYLKEYGIKEKEVFDLLDKKISNDTAWIGLNLGFDISFINKFLNRNIQYYDIMTFVRECRKELKDSDNLIDVINVESKEKIGTFNKYIYEYWKNGELKDKDKEVIIKKYFGEKLKDGFITSYNGNIALKKKMGNEIEILNLDLNTKIHLKNSDLSEGESSVRLKASGNFIASYNYTLNSEYKDLVSIADDNKILEYGSKNEDLGIYHLNASVKTDDTIREFFLAISIMLQKGLEPDKVIELFTKNAKIYSPKENIFKDYLTLSDASVLKSSNNEYKKDMVNLLNEWIDKKYIVVKNDNGDFIKFDLNTERLNFIKNSIKNEPEFLNLYLKKLKEFSEIYNRIEEINNIIGDYKTLDKNGENFVLGEKIYNLAGTCSVLSEIISKEEIPNSIKYLDVEKSELIYLDLNKIDKITNIKTDVENKLNLYKSILLRFEEKNYEEIEDLVYKLNGKSKNSEDNYIEDEFSKAILNIINVINNDIPENEKFIYIFDYIKSNNGRGKIFNFQKLDDIPKKDIPMSDKIDLLFDKITSKIDTFRKDSTTYNNNLTSLYLLMNIEKIDNLFLNFKEYQKLLGIDNIENYYSKSEIINDFSNLRENNKISSVEEVEEKKLFIEKVLETRNIDKEYFYNIIKGSPFEKIRFILMGEVEKGDEKYFEELKINSNCSNENIIDKEQLKKVELAKDIYQLIEIMNKSLNYSKRTSSLSLLGRYAIGTCQKILNASVGNLLKTNKYKYLDVEEKEIKKPKKRTLK